MASKLTPTKSEATKLLRNLEAIAKLRLSGLDVRKSIHKERVDVTDRELRTEANDLVLNALPTFLLIRAATITEECIDILWARRFPDIKSRRIPMEEKLAILDKFHGINAKQLLEVWKLRNECVHQSSKDITWAQFGENFNKVWTFVDRYTGRYMKRASMVGDPARARRG